MEMLVALAILSLMAGLAFGQIGPWLRESRRISLDADFWRAAPSAQITLSELAAGAVNIDDAFTVSEHEARLLVYAPRLADAPLPARLWIETDDQSVRLKAEFNGATSILLTGRAPMRFAQNQDALIVETRAADAWTPVLVAPLRTNGPITCRFDLIARQCL